MPLLTIGTSGWQYRDWKERFYPNRIPQRAWLEHYAGHFPTVEVNNTFYRLPKPETFTQWAQATPEGFRFALKASRYLTHTKRLHDPKEPVDKLMEHCAELGSRLGPILLQLPPTLKSEPERLDETLSCFPDDIRIAVEFRHDSWFSDQVRAILLRHDAATCLADRRTEVLGPLWRTSDWGYLRLHEGAGGRHPSYCEASLLRWIERLEELFEDSDTVYVYFNNDQQGAAVEDARTLRRLTREVR